MLNGSFTRWFLLWFLAVVLLLCVGLGIRVAAAAGNAATGPSPTGGVIAGISLSDAGVSAPAMEREPHSLLTGANKGLIGANKGPLRAS